MYPDTLVETCGLYINCSLPVTATITVMQELFVKLQVCWLMRGSVCAVQGPNQAADWRKKKLKRIWLPS